MGLMWMLFASWTSLTWARVPVGKTTCSAVELKRQDCRLVSGSYTVRLLANSVAWNDGTWNSVDEMPLKGEADQWEKIQFGLVAERPILQIWLWDEGIGESVVQSLHWYVADADRRHLTILAEGIVRKRRPKPKERPIDPRVKEPTQYLYDAPEKHQIKGLKKNTIEWTLGREHKILEIQDGV